MPLPVLQMGTEALCFRVVRPCVRASGRRRLPTGLSSTSSSAVCAKLCLCTGLEVAEANGQKHGLLSEGVIIITV